MSDDLSELTDEELALELQRVRDELRSATSTCGQALLADSGAPSDSDVSEVREGANEIRALCAELSSRTAEAE